MKPESILVLAYLAMMFGIPIGVGSGRGWIAVGSFGVFVLALLVVLPFTDNTEGREWKPKYKNTVGKITVVLAALATFGAGTTGVVFLCLKHLVPGPLSLGCLGVIVIMLTQLTVNWTSERLDAKW